jgi:hypothetical protein
MEGHFIHVRGAREHNLKDVDVAIPRDRLTVITGLSGSGKSSLAFDTIYAEGQRRYVESLSAYARQFLELAGKPDVDAIEGLSPAISIDQKTTSRNPRSTVGTVTEIHDYMRLLWARVGVPYSPATGLPIEAQTVSQMVDRVMAMAEGTRLLLLAPVVRDRKGEYRKELAELQRRGFTRVKVDGTLYEIAEVPALNRKTKHEIEAVVDRVVGWNRAWPTASRPRSASPTGSPMPRTPTAASAPSFPPASPARSAASPSRRSSRACSASTARTAPARPVTASAPRASSTRPLSYRTTAPRSPRAPSRPGPARRRPITTRPCKASPATSRSRRAPPGASCRRRCARRSCSAPRSRSPSPTRTACAPTPSPSRSRA